MNQNALYGKETSCFLDHLDTAINANSFLLSFDMVNKVNNIETFLLEKLRSGEIQDQVFQHDLERGWENYWQMEDNDQYQKLPGQLWNGKAPSVLKNLSREQFQNLLFQILTSTGEFSLAPTYCQPLETELANSILLNWELLLDGIMNNWTVYQCRPDFINEINGNDDSGSFLSYFSGTKRDFVFAITSEKLVITLLLNGGS